ncbi:cell division protein FtsQ/DivIB [Flavobacteriaceae bacterium]|jgi:cell division protein FtsQ|nr:cell division protein FtsQ/DivIB [Flavobacteriaceae bacterium]MDC0462671.1 cell division protein FtsQ/DivIB [Flavobacteriaceae bacterium]|tara:strand:+ start:9011 stop:9730 length:720 start_codon:yes stop_codon:yes gene_type:complete
MRINLNFIKGLFLLGLVLFLYAFSSFKNNSRLVKNVNIQFMGSNNVFITTEMVNKLLIQSQEKPYFLHKDDIDLRELEFLLESNSMIKSAQVYLTVNGVLMAKVEQKVPIARVQNSEVFYIDDQGFRMPLSTQHSARVPVVYGIVEEEDLKRVYKLALTAYNDTFLKTYLTEIHQNKNKEISLKLRLLDFEVSVGNIDNLEVKLKNLKAFYQKAKKDNMLDIYKSVNLQFDNQVVCTKK